MRYNRIAKDLNLTEEHVAKNLMFAGNKVGEAITTAMPEGAAAKWFGGVPPDLSLVSRSKGTDWIYTYLKSFYDDEGIVELTGLIAFQNLSSKFNNALDVPAQGFCPVEK